MQFANNRKVGETAGQRYGNQEKRQKIEEKLRLNRCLGNQMVSGGKNVVTS
jgi:hypothetical protein